MLKDNLQTFNIDSKKTVNEMQFENICRVQTSNDKTIKKVLSVHAMPMITSSERVGDNLSFAGVTNYQVVYLDEENKISGLNSESSWQNTIALPSSSEYFINVSIKENNVTDSSLSEVVISSLLNIELEMIITDTIESVAFLPEEYVVKEHNYSYNKVVNTIKDSFTEVAEQELTYKIDEILYNQADVKLLNATANIDSVTIEGEVSIVSFALTETGVVKLEKSVDFKHEVSALNVILDNVIDARAFLNRLKVTCSTSEIDSKTNLIYTLDIGLEGVIYSLNTLTLIDDAFSIKKETVVNSECLLKETFLGKVMFDSEVNANFDAGLSVNNIEYFNGLVCTITDKTFVDDEWKVSGVIELNFVCDKEGEKVNIKGFVNFMQEVDAGKTDNVNLNVVLNYYRLLGDRDVEVGLKLNFIVDKLEEEYVTFISSIEEVEDREFTDEAISVYVVKNNQTIFDVAKNLCVKPEEIIMQNNMGSEEFVEGEKVVVYRPLDINF